MDRKDWLLAVLAAGEGEPFSPVQVQKAMFLLGKQGEMSASLPTGGHGFYEFEPYDYGPFCKAIYADLDDLVERGLVARTSEEGKTWSKHAVTDAGADRASSLALAPEAQDYIRRLAHWIRGKRFDQIVRAVYAQYPDYLKNSIFQS